MKAFVVAAVLLVASLTRADSIAARVNGKPITEAEVASLSEKMAAAQGTEAASAADLRQDALEELIGTEMLVQEAAREKQEASPAEVEQRLAEVKGQYQTPAAFEEMLKTLHGTEADLRRDLGKSITIQKLIARHAATAALPADAPEKFYKEHTDKFQHPAEVRASHILFAVPEKADPAAAKQRAEETLAKLRQGADFAKLARELSDDKQSGANGGDLGFFSREDTAPAFAEAAFALQPGQLSDLVQTPLGFHLIKVADKREAGLTPLTEVRPQLESFLKEQENAKQAEAYVDQVKQRAKIEIVAAPATPTATK